MSGVIRLSFARMAFELRLCAIMGVFLEMISILIYRALDVHFEERDEKSFSFADSVLIRFHEAHEVCLKNAA